MTRAELDNLDALLAAVKEETWAVGHPVQSIACAKCWSDCNQQANIYEVKYSTDISAPHSHIHEDDARLIVALRNHARELVEAARRDLQCECP